MNSKFDFNVDRIRTSLTLAANRGVTFNYHEKNDISLAFDSADPDLIHRFFNGLAAGRVGAALQEELLESFCPIDGDQSIRLLHKELKNPTLIRKDSKPRDWSHEILTSLFAAYVYSAFPEKELHALNDPLGESQEYEADFWLHLHRNLPKLFSRDTALGVLRLNRTFLDFADEYEALRTRVLRLVQLSYRSIVNHGVFAVLIDPDPRNRPGLQWHLLADITLYAEKHIARVHRQAFFRSNEIRAATESYIEGLDSGRAAFDILNGGYLYQDCFVVGDNDRQSLFMIFDKHEADETVIPCPACRSHNVQGNSYSSLGVKSWECNNPLCPDRSKFNRGKRYSFLQLLKQQAILNEENKIPLESIRGWSRDVQEGHEPSEVLEMAIRHYSLIGDVVRVFGWGSEKLPALGRNVFDWDLEQPTTLEGPHILQPESFFESSYFSRYVVARSSRQTTSSPERREVGSCTAFLGDSFDVLATLAADSIDGAVTSPPYYNAREYSQWSNIYTYLYDIYNVNRGVFRLLKPGTFYLFNIFDYFDNENNVSLSAMGEKRMILGAYIIDLFRRIGFECVGNIVWDKGEIEGKRGFNNGNFSPYYQAPFNCWEHIFVFRKPSGRSSESDIFPRLIRQKPVMKMIQGRNVHGHTAPFPEAIPQLLASALPEGSVILDPFAGSMTTAQVASALGMRSICVEKDRNYFNLGIAKLAEQSMQVSLI